MLSVTDFDSKGIISDVRLHARLYLDVLDADRSPYAIRVNAGTIQVDFEVDHPPPADSPPGDLLYKKRVSKNEKKLYISLI